LIILTSCSQTNLLTYKYKKNYTEYRIIERDTIFKIQQNVCYNKPRKTHDEFIYGLTLTFIDTAAAKAKKNLNLSTDTLIVKSRYGIFSIGNFEDENNKITGKIKIISWKKNSITIKENIIVSDFRRKEIKNYKGTRKYKRKVTSNY